MGKLTTNGHVQWLCKNYQRVNHIEVLLLFFIEPILFHSEKEIPDLHGQTLHLGATHAQHGSTLAPC